MKRLFVTILIVVAVLVAALGLAIALGGPGKAPPPMSSINDPFKNVDFSDLPEATYVTARDGTKLAFRAYPAAGGAVKGSVVLLHGSSASSSSMHLMAKGFAAAGYAAYTLDIRGHGKSGTKGHIAYIGQLEDDLEDFVHSTKLAQPSTLAGFSSGGGFVLRFAGSPRQELFSNYLLLSPWISQDAATLRPGSGGWATVGVPRIIAIAVLNGLECTRLTTCRWSDSRSTRGTKACSPRNIPSPSHRTSGLSAITRQTSERLGKLFGCSSVKTMTCRTPIGLQPFSRQLAKMFLLQFSRGSTTSHSHLIQSPSKRQSRRLKAWITKSLTERCRQPLADLMTTFDFMKQFPEFATLAAASGGSAPSR